MADGMTPERAREIMAHVRAILESGETLTEQRLCEGMLERRERELREEIVAMLLRLYRR